MKKILLFLSFLLMSIGMWGVDSSYYTITFANNASSATGINSSTRANTVIKDNGSRSYVTSQPFTVNSGNCYYGDTKTCIRIGKSGNASSLSIALSSNGQVSATTIVVNCDNTGGKNNTGAQLSVNGTTSQTTKTDDPDDYTFTINDDITDITLVGTASIRIYSITVNYGDDTPSYRITEQSNNNTYGTVSLSGNVIIGSPADSCRYASPAYTVTSGTATVSQKRDTFTVTPSSDCTVRINFERIPKHKLTSVVIPSGYGTVTLGADSVMEDSTTTAKAIPAEGYRFASWSISGDGATLSSTTTKKTKVTIGTSDAVLTANFTEAPTPTPEPINRLVFELLTDIEDLNDGDSIVILDIDNTYAMSAQSDNGNNRTASGTFDIIGSNVEITDNTVQIIRVDTVGGTDYSRWRLVVGEDSVLYASSSSSNQLKTASIATAGHNGEWEITIIDNIASVIARGNYTRNIMQYNMGSELFNCYNNTGQTPLKIYKKIPCDGNYSVIFRNNYVNYDTIEVPSCVMRLHELPINPSDGTIPCSISAKFVGWSKSEITGDNEKPNDLFKSLQQSPNINSHETFNAVFALKNDATEASTSIISVFKTKGWGDFDNLWTSNKDGYSKNSQGVQVTIATSDAGATTRNSYYKITNIIVTYSTNTSTGAGTITVNIGDVELEGDGDVVVLPEKQGKTDRNITYTPNEPLTGMVRFSVTCSEKSIYIKSIQINYTDYEYDFYQTYCTDTLKSTSSWSNGESWSLNRAPQSNERAVILQPVTVDIPHANAKEVILTQSGKLTIGANKGLEVQDTISIHDGTYRATTPNDLILKSSDAGNASLIFNNSNQNSATVNLYSKATYPGLDGENADWQYIGTSITSLNALYNYYGSWLYEWVGEPNKWQAVPNGGTMKAWKGYCITQREEACHETSGQLVATNGVVELPIDSPHTVVANSWTAPIHISKFADDDFYNLSDKRIYLFNTGFDEDGNGDEGEGNTAPGTYTVIPIHASPYTGDSLIPSQQGFFVKTATNGTLKLDYNKLVRTGGSGIITAGALRAPKRTMSNNKPNVLKIYAHGSRFSDRLTILEREDFSTGFDNGWDGDKMSFSNLSPSIYVINQDGSYDEVSAIPDYEGTVLGFKSGSDSICRLTFSYDGDNTWYLNDLVTLTSTLIDSDSEYVFTHDSENDVRFIISATPYAGVATDIDKVSDGENSVHKYLHNGNLYIIKNNRIFNAIGSLIQ